MKWAAIIYYFNEISSVIGIGFDSDDEVHANSTFWSGVRM